jgi:hypothetical protein
LVGLGGAGIALVRQLGALPEKNIYPCVKTTVIASFRNE